MVDGDTAAVHTKTPVKRYPIRINPTIAIVGTILLFILGSGLITVLADSRYQPDAVQMLIMFGLLTVIAVRLAYVLKLHPQCRDITEVSIEASRASVMLHDGRSIAIEAVRRKRWKWLLSEWLTLSGTSSDGAAAKRTIVPDNLPSREVYEALVKDLRCDG
jgi:hypothetical protein